jgi:2-hydroxy-3-keto-5-methylthiopentenyl-1-phosphate phosphatase
MRISLNGVGNDQRHELRKFAEEIVLIGDRKICDLPASDDCDYTFFKMLMIYILTLDMVQSY